MNHASLLFGKPQFVLRVGDSLSLVTVLERLHLGYRCRVCLQMETNKPKKRFCLKCSKWKSHHPTNTVF